MNNLRNLDSSITDNIDFFIYMIGINDMKNNNTTTDQIITNINNLISALKVDYPNVKIIIGYSPNACSADGWSVHFKTRSSYTIFINNMIKLECVLNDYVKSLENVYLCNTSHFIDKIYGYPYINESVSSRYTEEVLTHTDSVHPNESGYGQLADAFFATVKSLV